MKRFNEKYFNKNHLTQEDIKNIRKELNMNQKEFSLALNLSRSKVSRWENGWSSPTGIESLSIGSLYEEMMSLAM